MARLRALGAEGKRRIVQVLAAVLYNANIGGFLKGEIYRGNSKKFCVPGRTVTVAPGDCFLPVGGLAGVAQQFPFSAAAVYAGHFAGVRRAVGAGNLRIFVPLWADSGTFT